MRIAALSPNWNFLSGLHSMHLYAEVFIKNYCEKEITYEEAKTYDGDVIVCFNGRPDLPENCPPKEFKGLKIVHLMDHVFQTEKTVQVLRENEVEYVMCYNRHDKYDKFFQHFYKDWIGKVIPVPFGYNSIRFIDHIPFKNGVPKCIALGSVNPVSDPLCINDIKEYAEFYKHEKFTHKWRRRLVENATSLENEMHSFLPEYPKTKNFDYDIAFVYNNYKMFTSGESIMNYPSVKTFEGMACGSVLVCSDHDCYKDLGFIGDLNCIMHKQNDLENFKAAISYYQNDLKGLEQISRIGKKHVETNYSPKAVAVELYNNILSKWMFQ